MNVIRLFSIKSLSACLPRAILNLLIISVNAVQNNVSSNGAVSEIIFHLHINTTEQRPKACSDPTKKDVEVEIKRLKDPNSLVDSWPEKSPVLTPGVMG